LVCVFTFLCLSVSADQYKHRIELLLAKDQEAVGASPAVPPAVLGAGRREGFAWSMWFNTSTDISPWGAEMTIFRGIMDWPANPWVQKEGVGGVLFQFGLKQNHSFTFRYDGCVFNSPVQPHLKPWQWNHVGLQLTQLGQMSVYWNGRRAIGPVQCGPPLVDYDAYNPQWKVSSPLRTKQAARSQLSPSFISCLRRPR